jgi:glycosyltransferase involved in cell wall biosynthesis
MREKDGLVSVIIPVFNGEKYLREAIKSVLGQTYKRAEIMVIDDGSTDSTARIAKHYSPAVKYFFQPNSGISAALNRGIEVAQGSFFAFLDADDLWEKNKLRQQMEVLANNPDMDIVFGQVKQFYISELDEDRKNRIRIPAGVTPGFFKGTMLIKRDSFLRVGAFETKWKVGDFIDWYLRAMEKGLKSVVLEEVVLQRRIHGNNMGIRERKSQTDFVRVLKASLDRRRSAAGENSVK